MKAKDYLLQVHRLDTVINNKMAEISKWRSIALGSTVSTEGERVQSSGNKQKMADAVCRYISIEEEINADIDKLVDCKQEIIRTIEQLPLDEYDVLHKRYIQEMELYDIAEAADRSYSWATWVHGRALANLQKILNERENNG